MSNDLLKLRQMVAQGVGRKTPASAFLEAAGRTGPSPQQTVQQTPGSVVDNARQRALMALGASPKPSMGIPQARLITPTTASSGLGSILPGRGTPGSAALGAFGQTMSQLGGWQDKPMTFGQILGASLGKAREAYGTAQERESAIAEKKAAAIRQAEQDELARRNIESQIKVRETPPAFKPGTLYDFPVGDNKFQKGYLGESGNVVYVGGPFEKEAKKSAFEERIEIATGLKRGQPGFQEAAARVLFNPEGLLSADEETNKIVRENLAKENVKLIGEARKDMVKDKDMMPRINQAISLLNKGVKTGRIESALAPFRELAAEIGVIDSESINQQRLLESVFNYLVPRFRVPGTGATSNLEIDLFKGATGSLSKLPGANKYIMQAIKDSVEYKQKYVNEMERYLKGKDLGNGSLDGFDEYFVDKFGETRFDSATTANLKYLQAKDAAGSNSIDVSEFDLDTLEQFDMSIVAPEDKIAINAAIERMISEELATEGAK